MIASGPAVSLWSWLVSTLLLSAFNASSNQSL